MESNFQRGAFAIAVILALGGFAAPEGYDLACWLAGALAACVGFTVTDPRRGTLTSALLAAGCNAYLFSRKLDSAGDSGCNINEVINCDVVNTSAASEMFGIPITLFGAGFYGGLALAALLHKNSTPRLFQVSALYAVVSLVYSAWLAYQATLLGAVCFVCITIYACNVVLLWAAMSGARRAQQVIVPSLTLATSWTNLIITGTFVVVVVSGAGQWSQVQRDDPAEAVRQAQASGDPAELDTELISQLYMATAAPLDLDGSEHVLGDPDAPYLLVEFADYGCPHCAVAAEELPALVREMPNVQVRFKAFPLSGPCNPSIQAASDPRRCQAAAAAECAGEQDKFWELQHLLFKNQTHLDDTDLQYMAGQAELDLEAWTACMQGDAVWEGIRADATAGLKAGVQATPSMFLRGTHGDQFVMINAGVGGAYALIQAHMSGIPLPQPVPYRAR